MMNGMNKSSMKTIESKEHLKEHKMQNTTMANHVYKTLSTSEKSFKAQIERMRDTLECRKRKMKKRLKNLRN